MNNMKAFVEVWKKEARILTNYLDRELKEASESNKKSLIFNFDFYSTYATLNCMAWLYEEGYLIMETNIENVYEIRW